jgi:hypothetical protein
MNASSHNPDELLARVADGQLDQLTPEQVAALEAHLNTTPAVADRLADVVPAPDPHLVPASSPPSEAEWDALWERVDSAGSARQTPNTIARVLRFWRPLAAVAACLLLVVLWRAVPWASEPSWKMQLSDDVVVHELEVFGDSSAFVAYSDDESGSAVIWIFEGDEQQEGA